MLRAAPFVPLTLTLSPKGRGDRLCMVLSPVLHNCRMRRKHLIRRPTSRHQILMPLNTPCFSSSLTLLLRYQAGKGWTWLTSAFQAWCRLFCISPARQKRGQPCSASVQRWRLLRRLQARFFNCLNCTNHHVVVMGVNHADVFAVVFRFDKALHDFFAFTAGEVT